MGASGLQAAPTAASAAETARPAGASGPRPRVVWVVVLNWNGFADTLACVRSLRELSYPARRIVVVDNGSTDGSLAALRPAAAEEGFDLVETGKNLGYAGGNNVGIRHALERGADFVLVLNNDTTVDPGLLDALVAAADANPRAGCFGPWILYMHDRDRLWFARAAWSSAQVSFNWPGKNRLVGEVSAADTSTAYVCGAALFFRAEVARSVGLLDERFFLVYEESDWCYRARRAGYECVTVPAARIWHKVGVSFGSEESPLRTYFSIRNKLLWAEVNATRDEWWRLLRGAIRRALPAFRVERANGVPLPRAVLWALSGFAREARRKRVDPQEIAHRRAVRDYLLRRFGDCPESIRMLARQWSAAKR